jgi:hypothetical protein
VLGLVFEAKIVGKPSIPLTLILSHQGRGKKGKWEKVRMRVKAHDSTCHGMSLH